MSLELLDLVAKLQDRLDSAEAQRDAWAEKAAEAGQYEALNKALGDRLGVYMTRLAEAREVLTEIEADSWNCPMLGCPMERDRFAHDPDCKLAKCLEGVND